MRWESLDSTLKKVRKYYSAQKIKDRDHDTNSQGGLKIMLK